MIIRINVTLKFFKVSRNHILVHMMKTFNQGLQLRHLFLINSSCWYNFFQFNDLFYQCFLFIVFLIKSFRIIVYLLIIHLIICRNLHWLLFQLKFTFVLKILCLIICLLLRWLLSRSFAMSYRKWFSITQCLLITLFLI